jgi:hypothetical protein
MTNFLQIGPGCQPGFWNNNNIVISTGNLNVGQATTISVTVFNNSGNGDRSRERRPGHRVHAEHPSRVQFVLHFAFAIVPKYGPALVSQPVPIPHRRVMVQFEISGGKRREFAGYGSGLHRSGGLQMPHAPNSGYERPLAHAMSSLT